MKKSTTMFDFFKRKYSNSSKVNVGLLTTNVAIPIPTNVDVPIPRNIHSTIPENANIPIPENNHISQTQFQKVDLDILRNNDFWIFVLDAYLMPHTSKDIIIVLFPPSNKN